MRTPLPALAVACLLALAGCPEDAPVPLAAPPAPKPPAPKADAGALDGGAAATLPDSGLVDGGHVDGGPAADGGPTDGGLGTEDGGEAPRDAFADVSTRPPGADITLDGQSAGTTPAKVPVASGRKQLLVVSTAGFFPEQTVLEPAPGETVVAAFTLRPAVTIHVTSDPPDASVTVNGEPALAATPGDLLAAPGTVELAVSFPQHDTFTRKLKVKKGAQKLDAKLLPSVKVSITSKPTAAEVTLDGKPAGVTPVDLWLSSKGKYTVAVTKEGWSTEKKVLVKPKPREAPVEFVLTDLELSRLEAAVAKALKAYDNADEALERAQASSAGSPQRLEAAEAAMQKATEELEEAQGQLAAAREKRGLKPKP